MANINDFTSSGFSVVNSENNDNRLFKFIKEHYPSIIRDNEIKLDELKAILGLPIDDKVNGYGLNFIGRNVARAKYAQQTDKELSLNTKFSKNLNITQNLVLKGDNLDSLKILKNHYTGRIKCIYIDPPYNTDRDEFIYPDKFDEEEAEVLGLANLSESDMDRLEFSFKSKKSHNGWLSFMYPRLLLARDLLSQDGVIFISIDDNEQANLKLLCDDIFGEDNFVENLKWKRKKQPSYLAAHTAKVMEYILVYAKNYKQLEKLSIETISDSTKKVVNLTNQYSERIFNKGVVVKLGESGVIPKGVYTIKTTDIEYLDDVIYVNGRTTEKIRVKARFSVSQKKIDEYIKQGLLFITVNKGLRRDVSEEEKQKRKSITDLLLDWGDNQYSDNEIKELFSESYFDYTKPTKLIYNIVKSIYGDSFIVLDFFAGSGTTGQAVMELNKEDNGNRKFILCQLDEPIDPVKNKSAYDFCIKNNFPPVISSITIERLNRAGEQIKEEIEKDKSKAGLFDKEEKKVPDIGYKVFDSVEAPRLELDGDQIRISYNSNDPLSRIYNMIFSVGVDEPTIAPEVVVQDCIYKIGANYYITNSEKIKNDDLSNAIKNGKVFIDGWTASLNGTLQHYKEDVKIVF